MAGQPGFVDVDERYAALSVAFKLAESAERHWRRLDG